MSSTITLQKTIDISSRFIYNAPLLYVNSGELAFSVGDYVRQLILSPPFIWRWNRAEVAPITCQAGKTDYTVSLPDFGWLERAWILYPSTSGVPIQVFNSMNILSISATAGTVTAVVNGNPLNFGFQIGQTIGVEGVTDSTFNSFNGVKVLKLGPNTISYTKVGTGVSSSGGQIFNITTLATPTIAAQGAPLRTFELTISQTLAQESVLGQPAFISVIKDDNNGNITFRLQMAPDQAYTLYIIYQKASPTFGATTDTWAPIPDYLSYLYNKGFLALTYEYKGDERFAFTHSEFLKLLVAASDGLADEQKNIYLQPKLITQRELGTVQANQQSRAGRGGA